MTETVSITSTRLSTSIEFLNTSIILSTSIVIYLLLFFGVFLQALVSNLKFVKK